jgi:hypothetical protein
MAFVYEKIPENFLTLVFLNASANVLPEESSHIDVA